MKRIYSLLLGALLAVPTFAEGEVDVTNLLKNPGFDADLTWNADGTRKPVNDNGLIIGGRSKAMIAADGSLYADAIVGGSSWSRTDGVESATNGFLGQVQGWTLNTESTGEWTYFGVLPYGLEEHAIPNSDNTQSFLSMPAKPSEDNGEDNKGALYLRAGWSNYAAYTQVVNLPCAEYRLEYWVKNLNYSRTNSSGVENLCQVQCRHSVFADEDGVNAGEWTKHTISFMPTYEFTIQLGFKSGQYGSDTNPLLLIDGIKLYKIGEADKKELLKEDLQEDVNILTNLKDNKFENAPEALKNEIQNKIDNINSVKSGDDVNAMEACYKSMVTYINSLKANVTEYVNLTDGETFSESGDKEHVHVTYTRTFNNTAKQPLYVPFAMQYDEWKDNFNIYEFVGFKKGSTADEFTSQIYEVKDATKPNSIYLIQAKNTGTQSIVAKDTPLRAAPAEPNVTKHFDAGSINFDFCGTYQGVTASELNSHKYWCMAGGTLYYPTDDNPNDLNPYRWYLNVTDTSGAPVRVRFRMAMYTDGATDIEEIGEAASQTALDGKYIENGKVIIVKNGQKYDLNGRAL